MSLFHKLFSAVNQRFRRCEFVSTYTCELKKKKTKFKNDLCVSLFIPSTLNDLTSKGDIILMDGIIWRTRKKKEKEKTGNRDSQIRKVVSQPGGLEAADGPVSVDDLIVDRRLSVRFSNYGRSFSFLDLLVTHGLYFGAGSVAINHS